MTLAASPVHRASAQWQDTAEADNAWQPPLTREQVGLLRPSIPQISPWRVVAVQLAAGLVCVGVAGLLTQRATVAWSAAYGAAATVLPSAVLARGMTRRVAGVVSAAAAFLVWELMKIGLAVAMLLIAARTVPGLSWPALLLTMVVCMKVNWFALLWRAR